jgi:hypothetical protein
MEAKRTPRILVIGGGEHGKGTLAEVILREKYGEDLVIVTAEDAMKQGLGPEHFDNVPTMRIEASPTMHLPPGSVKCGREKRRERRAAERRSKRKRGN